MYCNLKMRRLKFNNFSMVFHYHLEIEFSMMSLGHLRRLLENLNIVMNRQSIRMNLSKDGKGKIKVKVNGSRKEKGLRIQKRKKMWHHKRISM